MIDRTARHAWATMQSLRRRCDDSGRSSIEAHELEHLVRAALRRAFPDVTFTLFMNAAGWGELIVEYTGGPAARLVDLVVQPFAFDEDGENWLLPDGRMTRAWRTDAYGDPGLATDCRKPGAVLVVGGPADVRVQRREGVA